MKRNRIRHGLLLLLLLPGCASRPPVNAPLEQRIACIDVPQSKRPDYGCFNVAHMAGLTFSDSVISWFLYRFPSRSSAEAARSRYGFVWEEDGVIWLSELGTQPPEITGGQFVAKAGPLILPAAPHYMASYSYAVLRPGQRSLIHQHPGPEAWYVLAGEQCAETSVGVFRGRAGQTMVAPANVPMELTTTGSTVRRALVLVVHDDREPRGKPVEWEPRGLCG